MLTNATLISIAPPPTVDSSGGRTSAEAVSICVRCLLDKPRRAQLLTLANRIQDATDVLYVERKAIGENESLIVPQARVSVRLENTTANVERQVIHVETYRLRGRLDHVEAFLKVI